MYSQLKNVLKRVRDSQPVNWLATSIVRACTPSPPAWAVKHLPRIGYVTSRLPNGKLLKLRSRGDDWVSNQVFWRGWQGYEPETTPIFYQLATAARVTFDVGAHVGFYSLLAAHANPAGKVYAFEPMTATFNRLQSNIVLNELNNISATNAAVAATDGTAEFYHGSTYIPCSCGLSADIFEAGTVVSSFQVPVISLDNFVRRENLTQVDLIKIDVETTEFQVLQGMAETLRRDQPDIICELWEGPLQIMDQLLSALGYQCYALELSGPQLYEGAASQSNYLFSTRPAEQLPRITVR